VKRLMELDFRRNLMSLPTDVVRAELLKCSPELDEEGLDSALTGIRRLQELDPLAAVQEGLLKGGEQRGQFTMSKMVPNFEMALYIAQAIGASIVTDSQHRWSEIQMAVTRQGGGRPFAVPAFAQALAATPLGFVNEIEDFMQISATGAFDGYAPLFRDVFNYLAELEHRGAKPNWEGQLSGRLSRINRAAQKRLRKDISSFTSGAVRGIFPAGGIQDNTVNRLLLMSSSEHHLSSVPMAFFIGPAAN